MKKWFTTNYHYIVPEIEESTEIRLNGTKPFDEFNEAKARGILTKPVLIGPYTFLKLARNAQAEELTYDKGLVNAVAAVYAEVIKLVVCARGGGGGGSRTSCSTRRTATSPSSRACTRRSCPLAKIRSRCCSTRTSATSPTCTRP